MYRDVFVVIKVLSESCLHASFLSRRIIQYEDDHAGWLHCELEIGLRTKATLLSSSHYYYYCCVLLLGTKSSKGDKVGNSRHNKVRHTRSIQIRVSTGYMSSSCSHSASLFPASTDVNHLFPVCCHGYSYYSIADFIRRSSCAVASNHIVS